mgnify:CR=1 FL=1
MDIAMQAGNTPLCHMLVRIYITWIHFERQPPTPTPRKLTTPPYLGNVLPPRTSSSSPFKAAARLRDTSIFKYFLDHWQLRFASNQGKSENGDYPLHLICCDCCCACIAPSHSSAGQFANPTPCHRLVAKKDFYRFTLRQIGAQVWMSFSTC